MSAPVTCAPKLRRRRWRRQSPRQGRTDRERHETADRRTKTSAGRAYPDRARGGIRVPGVLPMVIAAVIFDIDHQGLLEIEMTMQWIVAYEDSGRRSNVDGGWTKEHHPSREDALTFCDVVLRNGGILRSVTATRGDGVVLRRLDIHDILRELDIHQD